jgi:multicomponent Na+:H+ antiporter subunit E
MLIMAALPAGLWWLLSGGSWSSWIVGIPAVLASSWAIHHLHTARSRSISISGLISFIPVFLWGSLRGGFDVATRTLTPSMRIRPGFVIYPIRLQGDAARMFFINCVSLLPGTLAADFNDNQLTVHMLDDSIDPGDELQRLEQAVQRIYPQPN